MALQEVLTRWGFEFDKGKVQAIERGTKRTEKVLDRTAHNVEKFNAGMGKALGLIKGVVAGYLGFRGFKMVTGDVVAEIKETKIWADRLGESVDEFAGLAAIGRQNRLEVEDLGDAMKEMAVKANDAFGLAKSKDAQELFKQMGISKSQVVDANGQIKNTGELLRVVADAYSRMGNRAKAAAAIDDLLGDVGMRSSKLLMLGREGIDAAIKQAKANGLVHSPETIKAAMAYAKLKKQIVQTMIRFRNFIASKLLPVMVRVGRWFRAWWREGDNARRVTDALRVAGAALAAVLLRLVAIKVVGWLQGMAAGLRVAVAWMRGLSRASALAAAKWLLIVGGVVLMAAAIEDLVGFAQGKDSVIGRLLGDGGTAAFLRQALQGLIAAGKELAAVLLPVFRDLWAVLGPSLKKIWKLIKPAVPFIGKVLVGVIFLAVKALEYLIRAIKWLVEGAIVAAKAIGRAFTAAWQWIGDAWDWVGQKLTQAWNWLKAAAIAVGKAIAWPFVMAAKGVKYAWDAIIGAISKAVAWVVGAIKNAAALKDRLLGGPEVKGVGIQDEARLNALWGAQRRGDLATVTALRAAHMLPGGIAGQGVATKEQIRSVVQSTTASAVVQPGAVQVTVNAPADAVGTETVDQINRQLTRIITGAVDDLQKPPATQGG